MSELYTDIGYVQRNIYTGHTIITYRVYSNGKIYKIDGDKETLEPLEVYKSGHLYHKHLGTVHTLVMKHFVNMSDYCVIHKDFNKQNNNIDNLEYVTLSRANKIARANRENKKEIKPNGTIRRSKKV